MTKPLSIPRPAFELLQLDVLDALTDLFALDAPGVSATIGIAYVAAVHDGQPQPLPIADIDEDSPQLRSEFDP